MYLFSNISYRLSNQEIESVHHPGEATTMLGLLKYSDDFSKAQGLNKLWQKDTAGTAVVADNERFRVRQRHLIQSPTLKGTFSFKVPLKHIFGYCEDYNRIVYGLKHILSLVRKSDSDAIFRGDGADAGKVTLNKISWYTSRTYFRPMPKDFRFTRASNLRFPYLWPTARDSATQLRWHNLTCSRGVSE